MLVRHDEDLWHMRILLAPTGRGRSAVVAPDRDVYAEDYSSDRADILCGPAVGTWARRRRSRAAAPHLRSRRHLRPQSHPCRTSS